MSKPWPLDWPAHFNASDTACDVLQGACICGVFHQSGEFKLSQGYLFRRGVRCKSLDERNEIRFRQKEIDTLREVHRTLINDYHQIRRALKVALEHKFGRQVTDEELNEWKDQFKST